MKKKDKGGELNTLMPWKPGIPSYPLSPLAPFEEEKKLVNTVSAQRFMERVKHNVWRGNLPFLLVSQFHQCLQVARELPWLKQKCHH